MNDFIAPGTPEHARLISPSKVASILGVSRFESKYTLWHRMKGLAEPTPPKDIFKMGHAMELAMAELYRLDHPDWRLSRGEVQFVTDKLGFPAVCTLDRRASKGRMRRVVELKIARDMSEWGDEGTGECPADYAAQVMMQMAITGYTKTPAHLVVLSGWYRHFTYTIEYDKVVADWIIDECRKFYQSLQGDTPPDLDDSVSTYETVRSMHPDIDGSMVEVEPTLVTRLRDNRNEISRWDAALRHDKAQLLTLMGNAEFATVNGTVVAQRRPHQSGSVVLNINNKAISG